MQKNSLNEILSNTDEIGSSRDIHFVDTLSNDPYAYLERSGFTSEKYKIEIKNLPKYYGMKEVKKLLNNKLKLNSTKIKVPSIRSSWIYVCFKSEEDKMSAIEIINKFKWKGCTLVAEEAKPIPDPLVQKRIKNFNLNGPISKKQKVDCRETTEKIKDATTPLWRIPLEQQIILHYFNYCIANAVEHCIFLFETFMTDEVLTRLFHEITERKTQIIRDILKQFGNKLYSTNSGVSKWWITQKSKFNGLPCSLDPIRYATISEGYRNKCEFSIGINEDTGKKTIGFRLGSYAKGSISVAPIDEITSVPYKMKEAVKVFEQFIQNSKYDVFNSEFHEGYWKQLIIRFGFRTNQLMLIVGIDPQSLSDSILTELKEEIKDFFLEGEGKICKVTSMYLQKMKSRNSQNDNFIYEHIFGENYITEKLLGRTFRISPQAFFQVNTSATEILYESIAELAELTKDSTLLDVCCGTGTIGICLSDRCGEILGIEISQEAIADAEVNSTINNVNNACFFSGKAEEILSCVSQKATKQEIVAIVDPPRAGLQQSALVQIRRNERINKLVYVSCDPKSALKNFIDLGRPCSKLYRGNPFLPVKAIPIDLFPYTNHCELLVFFKRCS